MGMTISMWRNHSTHNLAEFMRTKGDYGGAEPLYREMLGIRRKILGDQHPAVIAALNKLVLLVKDKSEL